MLVLTPADGRKLRPCAGSSTRRRAVHPRPASLNYAGTARPRGRLASIEGVVPGARNSGLAAVSPVAPPFSTRTPARRRAAGRRALRGSIRQVVAFEPTGFQVKLAGSPGPGHAIGGSFAPRRSRGLKKVFTSRGGLLSRRRTTTAVDGVELTRSDGGRRLASSANPAAESRPPGDCCCG